MKLTVEQLAERIGAELVGNPDYFDRQIKSIGPIDATGENDITFVSNEKHRKTLNCSRAGAVIVSRPLEDLPMPQLVVGDVNEALIEVLNLFAPELKAPSVGIDTTAKVGRDVKIGDAVSIGAYAIIDDGVEIGQNSVIGGGCKIGQNSRIGKNCRLDSNVVVYHNCFLGNNVIVQANTVIGAIGFGYSYINGVHRLIPHNGGVIIEDFVEIGANCCVDRAKFGNTIIGAGTKIDNLVQIAHNVVIGRCCLIAGQTGISGSCTVGDDVVMGGQVGLTDNIKVGNAVMIGGQTGVTKNIPAGQKIMGTPALELTEALRSISLVRHLPKMTGQLKELNKRLEELEAAKDHKA
ncbi:MAG: UDP-3-O-(3-hydroxymyristoyl)glucosamine N-acyltransferase [Sedimentisphaerales bacterium]|nr:UDP-3-O-(3-hydroxymyristoyl)glucosamine N-acyltransferase [Sedimentisphaerales bacterium]